MLACSARLKVIFFFFFCTIDPPHAACPPPNPQPRDHKSAFASGSETGRAREKGHANTKKVIGAAWWVDLYNRRRRRQIECIARLRIVATRGGGSLNDLKAGRSFCAPAAPRFLVLRARADTFSRDKSHSLSIRPKIISARYIRTSYTR